MKIRHTHHRTSCAFSSVLVLLYVLSSSAYSQVTTKIYRDGKLISQKTQTTQEILEEMERILQQFDPDKIKERKQAMLNQETVVTEWFDNIITQMSAVETKAQTQITSVCQATGQTLYACQPFSQLHAYGQQLRHHRTQFVRQIQTLKYASNNTTQSTIDQILDGLKSANSTVQSINQSAQALDQWLQDQQTHIQKYGSLSFLPEIIGKTSSQTLTIAHVQQDLTEAFESYLNEGMALARTTRLMMARYTLQNKYLTQMYYNAAKDNQEILSQIKAYWNQLDAQKQAAYKQQYHVSSSEATWPYIAAASLLQQERAKYPVSDSDIEGFIEKHTALFNSPTRDQFLIVQTTRATLPDSLSSILASADTLKITKAMQANQIQGAVGKLCTNRDTWVNRYAMESAQADQITQLPVGQYHHMTVGAVHLHLVKLASLPQESYPVETQQQITTSILSTDQLAKVIFPKLDLELLVPEK